MAAAPTNNGQSWPLFELFLDVPHPAASPSCYGPFVVGPPPPSNSLEQELSDGKSIARIQRFCFPEFDDAVDQPSVPVSHDGPNLNRFDQYMLQPKGFQNHSFSLQLQDGQRVYGHVRRYHPCHKQSGSRFDVGRRGVRALVILTRANGGDAVYNAILKSMEGITSQQAALSDKNLHTNPEPQKLFLHVLSVRHQQMCAEFARIPFEERRPLTLSLEGLECGSPLFAEVDTTKFLMPTSLLVSTSDHSIFSFSNLTTPVLPLLRCLGVSNTLRLVSALLSERRVILISASPTRLSTCARSALSILAQGLLEWQHLYIGVLTPQMVQYLAAPVPYLIGILSGLAQSKMNQVELGEVVIINLDTNQMETRGIAGNQISQKIPDLVRSVSTENGSTPAGGMGNAAEMLVQDLVELLKMDKKTLNGESALSNVGETAAKATKAMKSALGLLKEKGRQYLQNRQGSNPDEEEDDDSGAASANNAPVNTLAPDYIHTEACQNGVGEEEARIAFATFFLCLYGDMRWYLSPPQPNQLPQLDRNRFLQQKKSMGEFEGSPIWNLLQNLCHTQMLEQFVKDRVAEVQKRQAVGKESPLFLQCANYHRTQNIDFHMFNVRRVARQVAQANPSRLIVQTNARRIAMALTSNKGYDGDSGRAIAQLAEDCRECTSVLADVMSVIWLRLRDSRGMQWKHGLLSLQLLRNLIFHGPLAALAEATDGLDKLRQMKFYGDKMRAQNANQIRTAATQLYELLVDRAKLFMVRRVCASRRRFLRKPATEQQQRLLRDNRLRPTTPFRAMHGALHPGANVVANQNIPAQPRPSASGQTVSTSSNVSVVQDLLGFDSPPTRNAQPPQAGVPSRLPNQIQPPPDILGLSSPQPVQAVNAGASNAEDIFGIFGSSMTISSPAPAGGVLSPHTPVAQQQFAQGQNTQVSRPALYQQPQGVGIQQAIAAQPQQQQRVFATANATVPPTPAPTHVYSPHPVQTTPTPMSQVVAARSPPPQQIVTTAMVPVAYHSGMGQPQYAISPPPPGSYPVNQQHPHAPPGPSYPGQQPFAHQPPQQLQYPGQSPAQQQPPRANLSQFDPMAR